MAELIIDNSEPVSMAHLLDADGVSILQHGGVCTRLEFSDVVKMNLAEFLKHEVPRLQKQARDNELHLIRNSTDGYYTAILGDCVIKYDLTDVQECTIQQMLDRVTVAKDETIAPDMPYPLVCMRTKNENVVIIVYLQPTKRRYYSRTYGVDTEIWWPPVWFKVLFTRAGMFQGAGIQIVPSWKEPWTETELYKVPFPNVYTNGAICYGGTMMRMPDTGRSPTKYEIVQFGMDMFFNSDWNNHLVNNDNAYWDSVLDGSWEMAAHKDAWKSKVSQYGNSGLLKMLCVLEEPNGWRRLKFQKNTGHTPMQFLNERGML